MKSKRNLKKQIKYICGDLVGEALLAGEVCACDKQDEVAQLIVDLAVLQENALASCSFAFDKSRRDFSSEAEYNKAKHAYNRAAFSALHDKFNARVAELVHKLNQVCGLSKEA